MKAAPRLPVPPARVVEPGRRAVSWSPVPLRSRIRHRLGAAGDRAAEIRTTLITYTVGLAPVLVAIGLVIGMLWAMSFQNAP